MYALVSSSDKPRPTTLETFTTVSLQYHSRHSATTSGRQEHPRWTTRPKTNAPQGCPSILGKRLEASPDVPASLVIAPCAICKTSTRVFLGTAAGSLGACAAVQQRGRIYRPVPEIFFFDSRTLGTRSQPEGSVLSHPHMPRREERYQTTNCEVLLSGEASTSPLPRGAVQRLFLGACEV